MKNKLLKSIFKKGVMFALLLTIVSHTEVMIDLDNNTCVEPDYEITLLHDKLLFL